MMVAHHSQLSLLAVSVGILVAGGSVLDPGVPPTKRVNWQVRFLRSRITSSPPHTASLASLCSKLMPLVRLLQWHSITTAPPTMTARVLLLTVMVVHMFHNSPHPTGLTFKRWFNAMNASYGQYQAQLALAHRKSITGVYQWIQPNGFILQPDGSVSLPPAAAIIAATR